MGNAIALSQLDNISTLSPRTYRYAKNSVLFGEKTKILFVTPEFSDLIKAGGLGDVSAALPKALAHQYDVRVLIPGYSDVINGDIPIKTIAQLPAHADLPACSIGQMQIDRGVIVYVLICPELYQRQGTPYGDAEGNDWPDNHIRFARLGLAAAELAEGTALSDWCPDLVHAHDWPAALAPAYMAWRGLTTPSLFTIHNLAHQGLFDFSCRAALGVPEEALTIDGMEFYGQMSFLKAGVVYADHVTTVSKTYAREITTPAFGCGLEGLLELKYDQGRLSGITNGIDDNWHPATDPHLVKSFNVNQWHYKRINTRYVEDMFDLDRSDGPLFAVVSRLVHQKGLDMTIEIAEAIVAAGGRLVVMGRGEAKIESALRELGQRHPGVIGVHIGFNESDARRLFAGSDFLLMPSRFEPCGLSQMYAQRFGSLPIARCTGGLADTIEDGVNGFLFNEESTASYLNAIKRALKVYNLPYLLNAMRCHAMDAPLYWRHSVRPYDRLYQQLLQPSSTTVTYLHRSYAP